MNARRRIALCLLVAVLAACGQRPTVLPATLPATGSSGITATPARGAALHELVNIVETRADAAGTFAAAQEGQPVGQPNEVRTGEASKARLDFTDGAIVRLAPNTLFVVDKLGGSDEDPLTRFKFAVGKLWVSLTSGQFQAETPVGVATVRGSYAEFQYDPGADPNSTLDDVLTIKCIEGTCTYTNGTQSIVLSNLEQVIISQGGATITGPTPLPASAVADFISNSPESTAVILTLTAAVPSLTPSRTSIAAPSSTPVPSATRTPTQLLASQTPSATATDAASSTLAPTATRTRRPATAAPTATASETPVPPTATDTETSTQPPAPPPETDTPAPTASDTPTVTQTPTLTLTPTATFTPSVTATKTKTPTRTPVPTKTASPTP